jgi:eukaryotic-like serine/threonine-protein kinase
MNERWQEIERIYNAVCELDKTSRAEFLSKTCAGDDELRHEVESLLAQDDLAGSFLETPAIELEAESLAREHPGTRGDETSQLDGSMVSHYRVLEKLGGGGMGVVYKAVDTMLGRHVALKFLPEEFSRDPEKLARFRREAWSASALNHPNICTIHEIGEYAGRPFIAMELIEGKTIAERLKDGPLAIEEATEISRQIAEALQEAHEHNIIHRDLKPLNVMVTTKGRVKVLDFGLAKSVQPVEPDAPTQESLLQTQAGALMGTVPYMSPEQLRGGHVDARTDLYALGVVFYEMATGERLFPETRTTELIAAILTKQPRPPHELNSHIPAQLEVIILRSLAKEPDQRYQSAEQLLADICQQCSASAVRADVGSLGTGVGPALAPTRRTPLPKAGPRKRGMVPAAFGLLLAAGAGGLALLYFGAHWHRDQVLTEKDTIVLADFDNRTGDPVFDGTLRQGLSALLGQSPFLNLLSDQRFAQTVALMTEPKDARLTPELVHQVCMRTASAATIEGSIASLGNQYVLGLKAVSCRNGDLLAEEQVTANGKEQVLKALGEEATDLRRRLGESLASVKKYDAPPEDVTTPSLEALQAYSLGYRAMAIKSDSVGAISFFQRAIRLDPKFAMAYAMLGTNYGYLNETALAAENTRKAYEFRERVSERERFYISSHYETYITGDLEAARKICELWAQTYPRDDMAPINLGNIYMSLGEYGKAIAAFQEAMKLNPGGGITYDSLAIAYLYGNRPKEAKSITQEAQKHHLDSPFLHYVLYLVDFLRGDAVGMEREAAAVAGRTGYEGEMLYFESDSAAYAGQFAKARDLTRRASASAQLTNGKETAAGYEAEAALREVLVGNTSLARKQAQAALELSGGRDVEAISALTLALSGDSAKAMRLANNLSKRFPQDTIVQFEYLPMIHAGVILGSRNASKDADKAVGTLSAATPYEMANIVGTLNFTFYPVYLRGEACLAAGRGAAAVSAFQEILDSPSVALNETIGALARLGLGRAYALEAGIGGGPVSAVGNSASADTGRTPEPQPAALAKARAAYQDFFALWKDADPDIPILKQAKAEYTKLQ